MSERLDRRAFLGGAAAAAAIVGAAARPLTSGAFALVPDEAQMASGRAPPAPDVSASVADDDWHIDDMWGHTPRYAHPIPYAPMRSSPVAWEHVDPIDRHLVI